MSYATDYDTAPGEIDVRCPKCRKPALFTFARIGYVHTKADREVLERDPAFDLERLTRWPHHGETIAIYYPHLGRPRAGWARSLSVRSWTGFKDRGTARCGACGLVGKHRLRWPSDAVYACEVRGRVLWAWTRRHAVALRRYLASDTRRRSDQPGFRFFLLQTPKHFLLRKHRDEAVSKLEQLLEVRRDHSRPARRA